MRACRGLAALAGILLAVSLARGGSPQPDGKWIRVETDHFVLFSNAPERLTTRVGLNLERLRETLRQLRGNMQVSSPLPTYIYVFRNSRSFRKYVRSGSPVVGFFVGHPYGNYVAIDASPDQDPYEIIYHEYIHYFLHTNTASRIPTWFDEGLAEYYSTFTYLPDPGIVEVGRPISRHVRWLLEYPLIPLQRLFAVDSESGDYNEAEKAGVFYAQSWLVVHYLSSGDRRDQLIDFLQRLEAGEPRDEAFAGAFDGVSAGTLLEELQAYIERNKYPVTRYRFPNLELGVRVAAMDEVETWYRLGDYLAHFGGQESDAAAHFREALALQPRHAGAIAGLAYLENERGNLEEAERLYRQALEIDGRDAMIHFLYGKNLLAQHDRGSGDLILPDVPLPERLSRARDLFRESIMLNPGFGEAYAGLGYTYLFEPGDVDEGVTALRKARSLMPQAEPHAYNLMVLYLKQGHRDEAVGLAGFLEASRDSELRRLTRETLLRDDLARAERLLATNRLEEALALLRELRDRADDPELRRRIDAQVADVQEFLVRDRQIDTYNRAVELANGGRLAEAQAVLLQLLAEEPAPEPELARAARDLIDRLARARSRP